MKVFLFFSAITQLSTAFSFSAKTACHRMTTTTTTSLNAASSVVQDEERRNLFKLIPAAMLAVQPALFLGAESASASNGLLDDLPADAAKAYLQYRIPLQIAADSYIFDLQDKVGDVDEWGNVGQIFQSNNARGGQGQPSKVERDFVNPMRIVLLSMPPDIAEEMRDAQFKFESAMQKISKATGGYRKDLPVEIPRSSLDNAKAGWEEGRVALNEFFVLLNKATGLNEMKTIPAAGPNQNSEYGRSASRYNVLIKKTKLCQNRGGPALSQAWGQLMVSGYLQDSCGIPDLDTYFRQ